VFRAETAPDQRFLLEILPMTYDKMLAELRGVKDLLVTGVGNTHEWLAEVFDRLNLVVQGWKGAYKTIAKAAEEPDEEEKPKGKKEAKEKVASKNRPTPEQVQEFRDIQAEFATLSSRTHGAVEMHRRENKHRHTISAPMEVALCRCIHELIGVILSNVEDKE
jgi:hypothetical protein